MTKKEKILQEVDNTQHTRDNLVTITDIAKRYEVSTRYIYEILARRAK